MKCPTCGKPDYAPPDTYPSAEAYIPGESTDTRSWRFRRTGEKRPPRKGEWYLSGAIPAAYYAKADLDTSYYIVVNIA